MISGRIFHAPFIVCMLLSAVLPAMLAPLVSPASAEIPPAVERKPVSLSPEHQAASRFFTGECGKCHSRPDPVKPDPAKPACTKGLSKDAFATLQHYIADVRAGKSLYESRCGRCHTLIDPEAYSADYWSKNLCTSEECFIEKLRTEEEQQVLLYLSSHAKPN